ncbi:MAG: response regulator [Bacteroidota bacterium]
MTQSPSDYKNESKHLQVVIESTNAAIYAIDIHHRITVLNNSFKDFIKEWFNMSIDVSFNLYDIVSSKEIESPILQHLQKALEGKFFVAEETYGTDLFDKAFYETSYNPIIDEQGNIKGVTVFSQDITDKKRVQLALLKAKNEAVEAAQAKSAFLSNMSHEIRTPMNAIIGLTDLLLEKVKTEEQIEYVKSIKFSADNLLFIINDILDFSRIEAGKIQLEIIPFDVFERIEDVRKTFLPKVEEKGLTLDVYIDPMVPKLIVGDPYRLNQILFNLVGNAVKFTKTGGILLDLRIKKHMHNQFTLLFSITDTGIGIEEDKLENLFDVFTQAYANTARKYGGSGLGLAISKNLVELQHGFIGVRSKIGEGSTFFFEITYKRAEPELLNNLVKQDAEPVKSLEGVKILLVEDNTMNQFLAQQILKKWKTEVTLAENGIEAIRLLRKDKYDIVLMDIHMPEMNGYEATQKIRSGEAQVEKDIPIIALTADAFDETKSKVLNTGMNDFVTKPFKQEELYQKISLYLKK